MKSKKWYNIVKNGYWISSYSIFYLGWAFKKTVYRLTTISNSFGCEFISNRWVGYEKVKRNYRISGKQSFVQGLWNYKYLQWGFWSIYNIPCCTTEKKSNGFWHWLRFTSIFRGGRHLGFVWPWTLSCNCIMQLRASFINTQIGKSALYISR